MYVALSKDIFSKKDIFLEKCFSDLRTENQRKQQGAYSFATLVGSKMASKYHDLMTLIKNGMVYDKMLSIVYSYPTTRRTRGSLRCSIHKIRKGMRLEVSKHKDAKLISLESLL